MLSRIKRLVFAGFVVGLLTVATVAVVKAQWPTTCVELNDIVEAHLGNHSNVGIYQKTFGDQAEQACQNDHRNDVRSVFAWAIGETQAPASTPTQAPVSTPESSPQPTPAPVRTNWREVEDRDQFSPTQGQSVGFYVLGTGGATVNVSCLDEAEPIFPAIWIHFRGTYVYLLAYDDELEVKWFWNDDTQINTGIWEVLDDDTVLVPEWQIPEIAYGLVHAGRLTFRVTEDSGERHDAVFNFVGAGAPDHPVRRVMQACGITI